MNLWFLIEGSDGETWVMHDFGLFPIGHVDRIKVMCRDSGQRVLAIARKRKAKAA